MRHGLTPDRVAEAAADLADAEGLEGVTLARVAAALSVRPPSLYNHVASREDLLRAIRLRASRQVAEALRSAAVGRSGPDAVRALAAAYRAFSVAHPGRHAALVRSPTANDPELLAAADEVVEVIVGALRAWELVGDEAVHAVRVIRASLHGFALLETGGGFGRPVDVDASFARLVATLIAGLEEL